MEQVTDCKQSNFQNVTKRRGRGGGVKKTKKLLRNVQIRHAWK